jgi:hypothetical protein
MVTGCSSAQYVLARTEYDQAFGPREKVENHLLNSARSGVVTSRGISGRLNDVTADQRLQPPWHLG